MIFFPLRSFSSLLPSHFYYFSHCIRSGTLNALHQQMRCSFRKLLRVFPGWSCGINTRNKSTHCRSPIPMLAMRIVEFVAIRPESVFFVRFHFVVTTLKTCHLHQKSAVIYYESVAYQQLSFRSFRLFWKCQADSFCPGRLLIQNVLLDLNQLFFRWTPYFEVRGTNILMARSFDNVWFCPVEVGYI